MSRPADAVLGVLAAADAALGGVLALLAPRPVLVLVLLPAQLLLAAAWLALLGVPARPAGTAIAAAAAVAADVVLASLDDPGVGALVGVVGLGVVAAVLGQLVRRDRTRVTDVLAGQSSAVLLGVMPAPALALAALPRGERVLAAALFAVAAALLVGALPQRRAPLAAGVGAGLAGAVAGVVAGVLAGTGTAVAAGATAGLLAAAARLALPRGAAARSLAATLPFAAAVPVAYLLGRVLLG